MVGIPGAPRVGDAARPKAETETNNKYPGSEIETSDLKRLAIYYGSNTGTCKSFAEDIQTSAPDFGFQATAKPLDSAVENLPKDVPVLILTSSYEGQPPMNAGGFVSWLQGHAETPDFLQGVSYSVLGVGNSEWINTFHRVPKLVDSLMSEAGAKRLHPIGLVDVKEDIMGAFESWKLGMFPAIREAFDATSEIKRDEIKVEVVAPDTPSKLAGEEVTTALVTVNKEIAKRTDTGAQKKHMEVLLPAGSTYQSGKKMTASRNNMSKYG
jgi:cytochrome P450/NADPH-cytochrome P450 reductase